MDGEAPPGGAPFEPTALKSSGTSGGVRAQVRFTPGTMLGDRYRVVALLGKGGMGEVYRAEDTRLGQQVALKFLPAAIATEPQKLQRLYDEVRVGRQVSHPNVCRLYDIAEIEGHRFIAMEYIDGEDLASLIRRIGKLPHEKALDLARDICAGLAAAHGLGIVHRDLKPANVMIDGRGNARITDFGLAVLAEELEERREIAGTPAYMAPEQLAGEEVTQKTDLYALGLLLYEIFTGKRLFRGDTFDEVVSQHGTTSSQSISRETATLDPAVQRVIVRCLEHDAANRPASIHSVIAALPGGDPLQAAIDAGETPSPEMLAAAGSSGELRPAIAWPLLILTLLVILAAAALSPRVRLYGQVDLPLEGHELAVRARQILATAGLTQRPVDTMWEFGIAPQYRLWIRERNRTQPPADSRSDELFEPLLFGYRESPAELRLPWPGRVSAFSNYPPYTLGGMARVMLEPNGTLRQIIIAPPEVTPSPPADTTPDWGPLFEATGLDYQNAQATAPQWRPPIGSDRRFAWLVSVEGHPPVRVEAATLATRPVWLEVIAPWKRPLLPYGATRRPIDRLLNVFWAVMLVSALVAGAFLALRNNRRGRGDRQGGGRLAAFIAACSLLQGLFVVNHSGDAGVEFYVVMTQVAFAILNGGIAWMFYLALEPYLRRRWPRTLISWSRILQKRWLDARVGRDLLVGIFAGASIRLIYFASLALPGWLGWPPPIPSDLNFLEISGWRFTIAFLLSNLYFPLIVALSTMVVLLIAHLLLRRRELAVAVAFMFALTFPGGENYPLLEWSYLLLFALTLTFVMIRYGLVALTAALFAFFTLDNFPITLDPSEWFFTRSLVGLALIGGLAIFGFVRALGSHAMFSEPVLED
jgi:predicted Ser/Thr protein kinase